MYIWRLDIEIGSNEETDDSENRVLRPSPRRAALDPKAARSSIGAIV